MKLLQRLVNRFPYLRIMWQFPVLLINEGFDKNSTDWIMVFVYSTSDAEHTKARMEIDRGVDITLCPVYNKLFWGLVKFWILRGLFKLFFHPRIKNISYIERPYGINSEDKT